MSQYKDIIYEEENGFAIITLNRPDRLNAVGWAMRLELPKAIENVRRNDNVQALIVANKCVHLVLRAALDKSIV